MASAEGLKLVGQKVRLGDRTCICGAKVDIYGNHGLSCQCSEGCLPHHASVNEIICCSGVPAILELVMKMVNSLMIRYVTDSLVDTLPLL